MFGVRRVIVGVSGSPGGLQALRYAADLARGQDAAVVPVLTWLPPGGDLAERRYPSTALRQVWKDAAWQRLWSAIELAFGEVPGDLAARSTVLRGEPGPVLTDIASLARGRAGGRRRAARRGPAAGLPRQPLLPGAGAVPGPGGAAACAGPDQSWPARLGVPAPRAEA